MMGISSSIYDCENIQNAVLRQLRQYFACRVNTFDELITVGQFIADDIGEKILDCFCLTEIDQRDREFERYIFLCEASLITINFDFLRLEICSTRVLPYSLFDQIKIGQIYYENFNFETHVGKLGIKFTWNDTQTISKFDEWNPFYTLKNYASLLLTSHPLKCCIENALTCNLEDSYFTLSYLQAVHRRFSIEVFHDKLFYILQSLHARISLNTPLLAPPIDSLSAPLSISSNEPRSALIQMERSNNPLLPTFINYSPIVIRNIFNLPGYIHNRIKAGYNRLRYV